MRRVGAFSANVYEGERLLRVSDTSFLESLDGRHGEVDVDLHVLLFGESADGLSERPDAAIVVGDLGDDILGILGEILYDHRLGLFGGVGGEICPRGNLTSKEEGDVGNGWVSQGGEIRGKASWETRVQGQLCTLRDFHERG